MTTTPPAATLTAFTDADPCPRVEILITPMPVGVDEITVYRSWAGQRSEVRGAKRAEVSGDYLVVDYEVPLGVQVSYTSVGFDSSGVPSEESSPSATTMAVPQVWIQDSLDPTTALMVGLATPHDLMVVAPSFAPVSYPLALTTAPVAGSNLPLSFGGVRAAASGVPLTVHSSNPTSTALLLDLLRKASPLCVRTPGDLVPHLTGLTYLAIPEVVPEPMPGWQKTVFRMSGDSVRGPGAGVVVQPRTFADLLDEAATFADLVSLYPTFLDVLRGL